MNSKSEEYQSKKKILDEISNSKIKISRSLYLEVLRFLKQGNEKKGKDIIFDNLPLTLRNTLLMEIYKPIINSFVFFKNITNTDFMVIILLALKPIYAVKNDSLLKPGEFMEEVIFVKNGRLCLDVPIDLFTKYCYGEYKTESNIITRKNIGSFVDLSTYIQNPNNIIKNNNFNNNSDDYFNNYFNNHNINNNNDFDIFKEKQNKMKEKENSNKPYIKILTLRKNEYFGIELMFLNKQSPLRIRVKSKFADLLFLTKEDVNEISSNYPQIWKSINQKSIKNYQAIESLIEKSLQIYYVSN